MGTEPHQHRAERILIWSITQVRDPARRYEIYLMKDLAGFDRRGWKTGFTFYRYAIPALAGYEGRAIFNDVDQIYFADPAELLDMDMGEAGVMWHQRARDICDVDRLREDGGCLALGTGPDRSNGRPQAHLLPCTDARKRTSGRPLPCACGMRATGSTKKVKSKLLHYTTVHSQPWRPFPKELRYRSSPEGEAWHAMERSADAAGFNLLHSKSGRHKHYGEALHGWAARRANLEHFRQRVPVIAKLVREKGAETLLDFGATLASRPSSCRAQWTSSP